MPRALKEPPPGPPWDVPLEEAVLAFLDLEMTGLEPKKDRVVEICIERVRGGVVEDRLSTLVRPAGGETGNVHIHGLSPDALKDAPTFAELADRVEALLAGAVPVAHGASWDVAFIEAEMARAGRPFTIAFYIDTLNLSRRALGLARHSLEALREHFGLDKARSHRADADVAALREVFTRVAAVLEPKTARDVWDVRVAERRARARIVAECKEALASKGEVVIVYRGRGKPAEPLRLVVTAVDDTRDPPRVVGYELPGRGRKELRADRILRVER